MRSLSFELKKINTMKNLYGKTVIVMGSFRGFDLAIAIR